MVQQQHKKKLFFNLKKLKNQLASIDTGNLSPENVRDIATKLDVKEAEVIDMENRLFSNDQSLNIKLGNEFETEWQDIIADNSKTQDKVLEANDELNYRRKIFQKAFKNLNDREKEILTLRKLNEEPQKLEVLSKKFNISRERVRQIEEKAIKKIKKEILNIT